MNRESILFKAQKHQQLAAFHTEQAAKENKEATRLIESLTEEGAATASSTRKGKLNKESKMKALANFNKSLYKKTSK